MSTTGCTGTWGIARQFDDEYRTEVLRCSGCGDHMVIIENRRYDVPATIAKTPREAAADAHRQKAGVPR